MRQDWTEVVGALGLFLLITTVVAVTIWQLGAAWRAKVLLSREDAYRTLAESAVKSQENSERALAEMSEQLTALSSRLANVERILSEVE